jgi:hypothetical protein
LRILSSVPVLVVGLTPIPVTTCGVFDALIAQPILVGVSEREIPRVESRIFWVKIPIVAVPYKIPSSHQAVI